MNLSSEEGLFSWMEEPLQFDLDQTLPESGPNMLRSFSKSFGEDFLPLDSLRGNQPCAFIIEKKVAMKECIPVELFGSPEPLTEGDDFDDETNPKWEDDLSQVIEGSDREVPVLDEDTKEELVGMPVKEFNVKTKALKLDAKVLQHLKLCRKRLKNRQAAIRSRSKKENETLFLQRRVDDLTREKDQQQKLIRQLQKRLADVEKQLTPLPEK